MNVAVQTQFLYDPTTTLYKVKEVRAKADQCVHFISQIRGGKIGREPLRNPSDKLDAKTPAALTAGTTQAWNQDAWDNQQKNGKWSIYIVSTMQPLIHTHRWPTTCSSGAVRGFALGHPNPPCGGDGVLNQ